VLDPDGMLQWRGAYQGELSPVGEALLGAPEDDDV
jgi:hypothetical protein